MAITFACAYLLCVLAPPVALAFIDGAAAFHCLTGDHHHTSAMAQIHDAQAGHQDADAPVKGGAAHHHNFGPESGKSKADGKATTSNCCGLFCVSAMPASPIPDVVPVLGMLTAVAAVDHGIAGRGPDRIDRPPIV